MFIKKYKTSTFLLIIILVLGACNQSSQWSGQEAIKKVNTQSVPIQLQHKGVYDLEDGLFISNDFEGARLNGVARSNDTLINVLITAENTPINTSPWYAFKIWSETPSEIYVKLSYNKNAGHRYYPKLSHDGLLWEALDSTQIVLNEQFANESLELPKDLIMKLKVDPDTLWVAAQELLVSKHNSIWMSTLESKSFVEQTSIGQSQEGRTIPLLKIGNSDDKRMIMVVSRQHPPEVTGYLGMQAFVEALCTDSELAVAFRKQYNIYVVPFANPDGVYHGHWRHNKGGVDLNRDWEDFNQPETSAIRDFMKHKVETTHGKFYYAIDFHSTWDDIYYTIDTSLKGNMPGLVSEIITETGKEFEGYQPNIKPRTGMDAKVSSLPFFFFEFGAESLVYEIGDDTERDFVKKKGEVSAIKMMEIMLARINPTQISQ